MLKNSSVKKNQKEIPFGRPWIEDVDRQAVLEVLNGHILTHGPLCKEFEQNFSNFVNGGFAVTTSSCMASLHLSSIYFNIKSGDEVIVPAQTHVATVHAIDIMGATPVFIDCELQTGNIDIKLLESKITSKTKAISLVHFAGIPVEMDRVCEITQRYDLKLIEDCALAVGGFYKNKHVGLWGDVGCFSFYPVKHITTGEGGMLISKNEETTKNIANLRAFSVDRSFTERNIPGVYDVTGVGLNYRMSEMQAALGCTQLKKIHEILRRRTKNFKILKNLLLQNSKLSVLDVENPDIKNSHYCLVVVLKERLAPKRNNIVLKLKEMGIGCSVYYPKPVPKMAYYQKKYGVNFSDYKNSSIISDNSIALPVGPHLNEEDMSRISETLLKIIGGLS